jgi:hypothetical protein
MVTRRPVYLKFECPSVGVWWDIYKPSSPSGATQPDEPRNPGHGLGREKKTEAAWKGTWGQLRIFCLDRAPKTATRGKFTGDDGPDGPAGRDDIL